MSVLVQFTPYHLRNGDWTERRGALGDLVVKTLAARAPDLPGLVEHGQVITPRDLEDDWGLTEGHIYQGEEALDQVFTMRPILGFARYRSPIAGLYLCGAGTHPGGGLTGANGRNAARAVLADRR
jgi:phytoene dehydrogenase-like protein